MMTQSKLTYPDDFNLAECHAIVEKIGELPALYERRGQIARQLLSVEGNTKTAVARLLGITPQSLTNAHLKGQADGEA